MPPIVHRGDESERWDLNPQPSLWQRDIPPLELLSRKRTSRMSIPEGKKHLDLNQEPSALQANELPIAPCLYARSMRVRLFKVYPALCDLSRHCTAK